MSHIVNQSLAGIQRALPAAKRGVARGRQYVSSSYPARPARLIPGLAGAAVLAGSAIIYGSRGTIKAESLDPAPLKQDLLPDEDDTEHKYATEQEVQEVIKQLKGMLKEDQVTTDPDDLLGHGHSTNTYHSE